MELVWTYNEEGQRGALFYRIRVEARGEDKIKTSQNNIEENSQGRKACSWVAVTSDCQSSSSKSKWMDARSERSTVLQHWSAGQRRGQDQIIQNDMEENSRRRKAWSWVTVMSDCQSSSSKSKWMEGECQSFMCLMTWWDRYTGKVGNTKEVI